MALSAKHYSSISSKLIPLLGRDEAEAFMSQFDIAEPGTPVSVRTLLWTEATLRAELAELRAETGALRAELGGVVC